MHYNYTPYYTNLFIYDKTEINDIEFYFEANYYISIMQAFFLFKRPIFKEMCCSCFYQLNIMPYGTKVLMKHATYNIFTYMKIVFLRLC